MTDTIETIRLSEKQKQQLIRLKTKTGIENWNVLCRWALCLSLAEDTPPPYEDIPSDSNVEMSWKVFAGEFEQSLNAVFTHTLGSISKEHKPLSKTSILKCHLNRGMAALSKTELI